MSILSTPLIHTKLNRPRVSADLVVRPRLYAALDRRRPLTVVVAPAGYGKTTLVSSWVERSGMPAVWLSLDPNDSNLETFLGYLLAAIERLHPAIIQRLAVGAGHGAAMSYAAVAQALADELDVLEDAFLLVLDDYHVVTEPTIHRFLKDLLQYPPRALNLVLATRIEPPLPLAILRGRDQLTEVRALDLRFTTDEIQEYLRHVLDQNLDAKTIGILEDTTEGWIAGLHLAALYLRNHEDIAGATARFRGRSRYTIDYLAVEVLARQTPEIQDFLVRTSILQRLNAALCDAVVGQDSTPGSSQVTLDHLENNNLFLVTLDDSKRWYRYHQLFQQLLEHRLRAICSIDEIAVLYRRASAWCASQNLVDEAVAYALSAGDIGGAVQIVEANRHAAICGEKWQRLEAWLELIPRRDINGYPELLLLEAWILHKRERLLEIPARLDLAEAILDEGGRHAPVELRMRSEIEALRSQQYFLVADATRTCTTARRAVQYAPDDYAHVRGVAWFFLALGASIAGGIQPALDILVEATRCEPFELDEAHTRILIARCFLYWLAADMPALRNGAEELMWFAAQKDLQESLAWAYYFRGCAHYMQNDAPAAADDFLAVISRRHIASSFVFVQSAFGLASALFAQTKQDEAHAVIELLAEYAREPGNIAVREIAQACVACVAYRHDNREEALRWVAKTERSFQRRPLIGLCAPPLVTTLVLLGQGTPAALLEAEQLLSEEDVFLAETHDRVARIEVLVQLAELHVSMNRHEAALLTVRDAVGLAQPGAVRRVFLDASRVVRDLLDELEFTGAHQRFIEELRVHSPRDNARQEPAPRVPQATAAARDFVQPRHPDLIELLTNREMEVLHLLAMRMTNKEIAQTLGISTDTVKQHAMNVFRKLHVDNRRAAVLQARAMGFQFDNQTML